MKAKRLSDGKTIEIYSKSIEHYYDADTNDYYRPNEIEIIAPEKAVIEGWVAVDEWGIGGLFLHTQKPHAENREFCDTGEYEIGWKSEGDKFELDSKLFPDMDCESDPQRVKIEITLIDEKGG